MVTSLNHTLSDVRVFWYKEKLWPFVDQALRELAAATVNSNHEIVYMHAAGVYSATCRTRATC